MAQSSSIMDPYVREIDRFRRNVAERRLHSLLSPEIRLLARKTLDVNQITKFMEELRDASTLGLHGTIDVNLYGYLLRRYVPEDADLAEEIFKLGLETRNSLHVPDFWEMRRSKPKPNFKKHSKIQERAHLDRVERQCIKNLLQAQTKKFDEIDEEV